MWNKRKYDLRKNGVYTRTKSFKRLDKYKSRQGVSGRKNQISEHMIPAPRQCVVQLQAQLLFYLISFILFDEGFKS
jgi:hypothetical protein